MDKACAWVYTRKMNQACYCNLLRKAARRVSTRYDTALAPFGINIAQLALLRMVAAKAPLSLTELGRLAELDRSTTGRNVRVLERAGLMKTVRSDDDQREAKVRLSKKGEEVLAASQAAWTACQKAMEAKVGPEQMSLLNDVLGAL